MTVSCSGRDSRSIGIRTDGKTVIFSTPGKKGPLFGFRRGSSGGGRIPYSSPSTSSNKQDKQGQGLNEVLTCVSNLTNRIENWREITTDPWTLEKNVTSNANCNINAKCNNFFNANCNNLLTPAKCNKAKCNNSLDQVLPVKHMLHLYGLCASGWLCLLLKSVVRLNPFLPRLNL